MPVAERSNEKPTKNPDGDRGPTTDIFANRNRGANALHASPKGTFLSLLIIVLSFEERNAMD